VVQGLWMNGLPEADTLPKEPDADSEETPQTNTTGNRYQYPAQKAAAVIVN